MEPNPPAPIPAPAVAPVAPAFAPSDFAAALAASNAQLIAALKPAASAPITPAAAPSQTERIAALESQVRTAEEKTTAMHRNAGIEAALTPATKDFSAPQLTALRAVLETQHGKNIVVEGDKTFYDSPQTGKIPLADFVAKSFLTSDIALALKPPPSLPGGQALAPGQTAPAAVPAAHKWAGVKAGELYDLSRKDPAAFRDLTANHNDTYRAILARR